MLIVVLCGMFVFALLGQMVIVVAAPTDNVDDGRAEDRSDEYLDAANEIIQWRKASAGIPADGELFGPEFLTDAGTPIVDWYAIAIGRLGYSDAYYAYLAMAEKNIVDRYKLDGGLDPSKATEWHRTGLAILSCGGDPTNLSEGINLVADGSYNRGKEKPLDIQGENGLFWGLIMMDALRYDIPDDAHDDRESILISIVENQKEDGRFGSTDISSSDPTAMALQALAPYYNSEERYEYERKADGRIVEQRVRDVIEDALDFISDVQQENGGFLSDGEESCESNAQIILALCALGIDPVEDARFIKNGITVVDAMMAFRQPDGGFAHSLADTPSNSEAGNSNAIASEQALLALAALTRFSQRLHTVFDFRPEPNDGIRELIKQVDESIELLGAGGDLNQVQALYGEYLVVPPEERCYVRNYSILAQAMESLGLANDSGSLVPVMNVNTGGRGYVVNLYDGTMGGEAIRFTDIDAQAAASLPTPLTMKDTATVTILWGKLQKSENRTDYKGAEELLLKKQEELRKIEATIDRVNVAVMEKLPPVEDISLDDYESIYEISSLVETLSIQDRSRVLRMDEIVQAKAKVDALKRDRTIVVAVILVAAIVAAIVITMVWMHRRKKDKNSLGKK
ncbi:MAG: prenyltransferase/squalene oxidase repeat-containing protein [Christensenellales bacterium]